MCKSQCWKFKHGLCCINGNGISDEYGLIDCGNGKDQWDRPLRLAQVLSKYRPLNNRYTSFICGCLGLMLVTTFMWGFARGAAPLVGWYILQVFGR
jgi:hypothetical protein